MSGQKEVSNTKKKSSATSSDQLLTTLKSAVDCPKLSLEVLQSRESLRVFIDKWHHFRARYKQPSLFSLVTVEVDAFLGAVSEPYLVAMKALEQDESSSISDDALLKILKKIYPPDLADVTLQKLRALSVDLSPQSSKPDAIIGAFGKYVTGFKLIIREGDAANPPQFKSVKKIFLDNISPRNIRSSLMDRTQEVHPSADESLSDSFLRLTVVFRKYCLDLRDDRARNLFAEGGAGNQLAEENASLKRKLAKMQSSADSSAAVNMNVDEPYNKKQKKNVKRRERSAKSNGKKAKEVQCFGCAEMGHARPTCPNKNRSDFVGDKDSRHPNCR